MPKKVYYHATGVKTFEWVDSLEDATTDEKAAAEVTLGEFKNAELVEVPGKMPHQPSKWAISTKSN